MIGLLGQKIGMTQLYDEQGRVVPVTLLAAGPCPIVQVKTADRDGYAAHQIGFGSRREKVMSCGERGHLRKHSAPNVRHLREVRVEDPSAYEVGQQLTVSVFEVGAKVDVIWISKGRGFAGVVKRERLSIPWAAGADRQRHFPTAALLAEKGRCIALWDDNLRHAFAVFSLRNGADLIDIKAQMGHSSIKTTAIYTEVVNKGRAERHRKTSPREKGCVPIFW